MTPISSILLPLEWTPYHRPRDWRFSTKQTEDRRLVWCEVAYVIDALGQGSDPQTRSTGGLEPNTNVRMSRLIVGTRPDTRMARGAARTSLVYCFFLEGIIQIAECRGPRSKKNKQSGPHSILLYDRPSQVLGHVQVYAPTFGAKIGLKQTDTRFETTLGMLDYMLYYHIPIQTSPFGRISVGTTHAGGVYCRAIAKRPCVDGPIDQENKRHEAESQQHQARG